MICTFPHPTHEERPKWQDSWILYVLNRAPEPVKLMIGEVFTLATFGKRDILVTDYLFHSVIPPKSSYPGVSDSTLMGPGQILALNILLSLRV